MEVLLPQLNLLTPTLSSIPAMPATIKNHKLYEVSVSGREQSSLPNHWRKRIAHRTVLRALEF